jgi:D-alanyl-D-alanine carboxypeptidase
MIRFRALPLVLSLVITGCVATTPAHSDIPAPTQQASTVVPNPTPTAAATPTVAAIDLSLHSIDDADSVWVVVDKLRRLSPRRYTPRGLVTLDVPHAYTPVLRNDAARAYLKMYRAARKDGINLVVQSGYRSYASQVTVYNGWVSSIGRAAADLQSARPGYSEHQTGLSVDIAAANRACTIQGCFGTTPEGRWLSRNAWKYGWHLRYPKTKTAITGYKYEPWHWRYVGVELATELNLTPKITLEEFFGLPAAPNYAR